MLSLLFTHNVKSTCVVVLCSTKLHYITLHYITLHYITLHYITLHYITLHYITLRWISINKIHCIIRWIVIYLVDSAVHLLSNQVQMYCCHEKDSEKCLRCYCNLHVWFILSVALSQAGNFWKVSDFIESPVMI